MAQKFEKLANARILIIGGSSGIGYAVAEGSLASRGSVIITSSNEAKLSAKITELKNSFPCGDITGFICDLSSFDTLEANLVKLLQQVGKVDHVVFTAGDAHNKTAIADMTIQHVLEAGKVRFFAPLMLAKHLQPHFTSRTRACSLTLTNSFAAARATGGWPAEASFTVAIRGLAESLAVDFRPVRVNVVGPGVVDTPIFGSLSEEQRAGLFERQAGEGTLTGALALPEETAEAYLWLMRDRSATGQQVYSDSGASFVTTGV